MFTPDPPVVCTLSELDPPEPEYVLPDPEPPVAAVP